MAKSQSNSSNRRSKSSKSSKSEMRPKRKTACTRKPRDAGRVSHSGAHTLRTYDLGALPILNHFLKRLKLETILQRHLPRDDPRVKIPTARGLLLLVRNLLLSREPIYGLADWAAGFPPELFGLARQQLEELNDDRLGRCLDRLFRTSLPELVMDVTRHVVAEFQLSLDELHNDSTSISFYGAYQDAQEESSQGGHKTHAMTWGFSKDHRPDLKQLLYILTVSNDGGVPVYFTSASGNVVDDQTHQETWNLLRQLIGSADFLYVADCKLATKENMQYIAGKHGRFITVLPKTRKEDQQFRQQLRQHPQRICWDKLYEVRADEADHESAVTDTLSVCGQEQRSAEGFRLLWYHSTRKVELDARKRQRNIERAIANLKQLQDRLWSPKTRFRQRAKVDEAVTQILSARGVEGLLDVRVTQRSQARYRQARRGRPGKDTPYVKEMITRYDLEWEINTQRIDEEAQGDGVFPLITNARQMTAEEVLRAYKRQPIIEKRFSQLKTDFEVAPVYLKNVGRIQALLCVYYCVLLVQTLLERQLRRAMLANDIESVAVYPENRPSKRPTARRVFDLFEPVQRHELNADGERKQFVTQLSQVQTTILRLLSVHSKEYRPA